MQKTKPSYKRNDERGTFLELSNGTQWLSVNGGRMHQDAVLGNHYHKSNTIHFISLGPIVRVEVQDIRSMEYSYDTLSEGEGVIIVPGEAHRFTFITPGSFLLMKSLTYFDYDKDMYPFTIKTELQPFE